MSRPRRSFAASLFAPLVVVASVTLVRAQAPLPPSMTVASFDGGVSRDDADAMADELAMRMVETGRFRVLERQWLPLPGNVSRPSIVSMTTMREAAAGAGVQYIVFGTVRTISNGRSASPVAAPSLLRAVVGPYASTSHGTVSVSVRVVDVASGDVIRTSVASAPMSSKRLAAPILPPGLLLRGPVGVVTAIATAHASMSAASTRVNHINPAAQRAIADIAHTLNMPHATSGQ